MIDNIIEIRIQNKNLINRLNLEVGQEKGGELFGEVRKRRTLLKQEVMHSTRNGKNDFLKEVVLVEIKARFLK